MHPFGVKVLCIEPGFFKTTVTDSEVIVANLKKIWERLPKETKEEYGDDFLSKGMCGFDKFSIRLEREFLHNE